MAHTCVFAVLLALPLGALTECATSAGSCAGVGPETDAATLLQAKAVAEGRFDNSQKSKDSTKCIEVAEDAKKLPLHAEEGYIRIKPKDLADIIECVNHFGAHAELLQADRAAEGRFDNSQKSKDSTKCIEVAEDAKKLPLDAEEGYIRIKPKDFADIIECVNDFGAHAELLQADRAAEGRFDNSQKSKDSTKCIEVAEDAKKLPLDAEEGYIRIKPKDLADIIECVKHFGAHAELLQADRAP